MNGIILYGSRYGAARQYAQALEEWTRVHPEANKSFSLNPMPDRGLMRY